VEVVDFNNNNNNINKMDPDALVNSFSTQPCTLSEQPPTPGQLTGMQPALWRARLFSQMPSDQISPPPAHERRRTIHTQPKPDN
jgi:hypothetical protein